MDFQLFNRTAYFTNWVTPTIFIVISIFLEINGSHSLRSSFAEMAGFSKSSYCTSTFMVQKSDAWYSGHVSQPVAAQVEVLRSLLTTGSNWAVGPVRGWFRPRDSFCTFAPPTYYVVQRPTALGYTEDRVAVLCTGGPQTEYHLCGCRPRSWILAVESNLCPLHGKMRG